MIKKIELFICIITRHLISFIVLSYIVFTKKKNQSIYLCYYTLGDTCYALSYRSYLLNKGKCKFYFSEGCKSMIEKCYSDIITNADVSYYKKKSIVYKTMDIVLKNQKQYSFFSKFGITILYPYILYFQENQKLDFFLILRRYLITFIPEEAKIEFPVVPKCEINSIEDFQRNKKKIVVLNLFSNSMSCIEVNLWESIANIMISNGFIVYSNVLENQVEIRGTKRLECSIIELYNICNEIPLFISIRSGIVDFTISSRCKKIIIWNKMTNLSNRYYNFYDIDAWGINNVYSIYHTSKYDTIKKFNILFNDLFNN